MIQTVNRLSNKQKQAKSEALKKKAKAMNHEVWVKLDAEGVKTDLYLHPEWREICTKTDKMETEARNLVRDFTPVVGEGATLHFYTDAHAFTIISVSKSGKSFKMQRDTATRLDDPITIIGGFSGHTVNNRNIRYSYEQNTDGGVIEVRMTQRGWKHRATQTVTSGRGEFYDYNF